MTDQQPDPQYSAPPLGAYPVDEHLRAQQEQVSPQTNKPLHDPETVAASKPEQAPDPVDTAEQTGSGDQGEQGSQGDQGTQQDQS